MKRATPMLFTALIAGLALHLASGSEAGAEETPQLKLANLLRAELEVVEGAEVIVSLVELPPATQLPKHYHPGEEFVYVLEGAVTGWQKGKEDVHLKQGDIFKIPFKQVHTAKTGKQGTKLLVFRVHKKGEPERVLVD